MRLTQLRLSGFKSFVDPTVLHVSRQLVGIVGPNGCGKSNVIDAVRWVLGESKASELRGENMHDVIFNGSSVRKPAGRASVELIFDNSAGRLGGPWSQYAEISVKRVLSRDGQSVYSINQQVVRRKDVHDLFLGTGLGPRAYAIIGQGMISRVIESKPEELRVFLEEAAGVSKYRERRRETESRLSDARENLDRVNDIRLEIVQRIEVLAAQAEVAQAYQEKTAARRDRQALLMALRQHESRLVLERSGLERGRIQTAMEALAAQLTSAGLESERARPVLEEAQEQVQAAQAALFELNTEMARQEAEDRAANQQRDRAIQAQVLARDQLQSLDQEESHASTALTEAEETLGRCREQIQALDQKVTDARAEIRPIEQATEESALVASEAKATLAAAEAEARMLGLRHQELGSRLARAADRQAALGRELAQLERMDPSALAGIRAQHEAAMTQAAQARASLDDLQHQVSQSEQQLSGVRQQESAARGDQQRYEAEHKAQSALLARLESKDRQGPWLASVQMQGRDRLWSHLKVTEGWQMAVGAALNERLMAVQLVRLDETSALLDASPPASVVFSEPPGPSVPLAQPLASGEVCLATKIQGDDQTAQTARAWLAQVFAAESLASALARRSSLPSGATLISREGHWVGRHELRLHGQSDDDGSGLLAQRDLVIDLEAQARAAVIHADEARLALARAESALSDAQQRLVGARQTEASAGSRAHELEVTAIRLQEKADRLVAREQELERSRLAAADETQQLESELARLGSEAAAATQALDGLRAQLSQASEASGQSASALQSARRRLGECQGQLQEARLAERSAHERVERIRSQLQDLSRRKKEALSREASAIEEEQLARQALHASPLQAMLADRVRREQRLADARNLADGRADDLRQLEERRLSLEREAIPLRDQLSATEVSIASVQATLDQLAQQLVEQDISLEQVIHGWPNGLPPESSPKPASLSAEIARLSRELEALGPVNLAALDELQQARDRAGFLEAQATDLLSAVETLEDAISKIDRESRALLQSTYDTVNTNLSRLFPTLFGGGEARLVLTGEEILDSGIQVMAQPPGKRNSSIHLLSGGEKALTATALVFALFQLNPAPFCLLDEVDAPLDDPNTERLCRLVKEMSAATQFIFITHNKIAMELAEHLVGVTMQEQGVSRLVAVDLEAAHAMGEDQFAATGP